MTEKIDWYKEVLELEPNSKVFYPLSRLLAEAGRTDEAVDTLEQGLARHEEFLEARLFLVELLHQLGQDTACTHCDYLSVCHFTPGVEGDCHRVLTKLPADKIWSSLKGGEPHG